LIYIGFDRRKMSQEALANIVKAIQESHGVSQGEAEELAEVLLQKVWEGISSGGALAIIDKPEIFMHLIRGDQPIELGTDISLYVLKDLGE
jgi:LDH2 family malate/lactate/ureidoglycolate dehydrogenase